MKWVRDSTFRFEQRPYYDQAEIDRECENLVTTFLISRYGRVRYPLATDDLVVMLERDTSDLDLYADLVSAGEDIEGETLFLAGKKPAVRIARELSLDETRAHRLRTTLAHEYGHVRFHAFLWSLDRADSTHSRFQRKLVQQNRRFNQLRPSFLKTTPPAGGLPPGGPGTETEPRGYCRRDNLLESPFWDWMEWQAAYAGGAILMPFTAITSLASQPEFTPGRSTPPEAASAAGQSLITAAAVLFEVSLEAARVRLQKLSCLTPASR